MAKVLIAEDDITLAGFIEEALSSDNHLVDVVNDGKAAQSCLRVGNYALAVLDWDLPKKKGVDICRDYKRSGGQCQILMLTGKGVLEQKASSEAGADDYLTKPFNPKELRARVKALLRKTDGVTIESLLAQAPQGQIPQRSTVRMKTCSNCGELFSSALGECPRDGGKLLTGAAEDHKDLGGDESDPVLGARLDGRYAVTASVARGGMAAVYKGLDERLRRQVAVKVLHSAAYLANPLAIKRLELEAIAVGKLKHPNIVTVYDFGVTASGLPYLVMDLVEGATLCEVLNQEVRLEVPRAVRVFAEICDALAHAHECGLIHRDLKPSNIMLVDGPNKMEQVKVLDFGIARVLPESGLGFEKLTQTGEFLGTAFYMSPEQCLGTDVDVRSDVYALGCLMYEALTGLPPLVGANPLATLHLQINEEPRTLSEARSDLVFPVKLEASVMKALQKSPSDRHQSMSELKRDLTDSQL